MKHRISITDENGKEVAFRVLDLSFEDAFTKNSVEEYKFLTRMREMYRDAAYGAGKRPVRNVA